ncbi:MAG: ABC transporter ATP-binding protein [Frisingicoccus sp.]
MEKDYCIELRDLVVHFPVRRGLVKAVDHVSVTFEEHQITGIIGESGCGKSVMGMAVLGLLPGYAKVCGEILYGGRNLRELSPKQMRRLRGRQLGLIPQNPGDSLNPVRRIGGQIMEAAALIGVKREEQKKQTADLLLRFGFEKNHLKRVEKAYPLELSGGMQQRALAAMGAASRPKWILADEPSKGLDVELRKQMYDTLRKMKNECVDSMLIITHDIALARNLCDSVAVMYSGQIIEKGKDILQNPKHPYTMGLMESLPENGFKPMRGIAPAPGQDFSGCKFAPRCPWAKAECWKKPPEFYSLDDRIVRCFLYA